MKRAGLLQIGLAVTAIALSAAWAQEGPNTPQRPAAAGARPASGPAAGVWLVVAEMRGVERLDLSDDQKTQLRLLRAEWQKNIQEWQAANKDKLAAVRAAMEEARRNQDRAAMRKAGEEQQALMAGQMEYRQKMLEQFLAVLTAEQKTKYFEMRAVEALLPRFRPANLTEDQLAKVREIVADALAEAKTDQQKASFETLRKAAMQVEKEILTDAQREAMKSAATSRPGAAAGASPDSPTPVVRPNAQPGAAAPGQAVEKPVETK